MDGNVVQHTRCEKKLPPRHSWYFNVVIVQQNIFPIAMNIEGVSCEVHTKAAFRRKWNKVAKNATEMKLNSPDLRSMLDEPSSVAPLSLVGW